MRDYLETLDWNKQAPGPKLPADVLAKTAAKYREALREADPLIPLAVLPAPTFSVSRRGIRRPLLTMNPLRSDFCGLPRFDAIRPDHVAPAIRQLLDENRALIARLTRRKPGDLGGFRRAAHRRPASACRAPGAWSAICTG